MNNMATFASECTEKRTITPIAAIHSPFASKFGIPRQSGIVPSVKATIIFTPDFRDPSAIKGLERFTHLWLIWDFHQSKNTFESMTVRPPRLGGSKRVGVFASRSPNRPNSLGLSSVKLESIELTREKGPILHVSGADILDNTPIYDIKPYIRYTDCHQDAADGFVLDTPQKILSVNFPENLLVMLPCEHRSPVIELLRQDPRPAYQSDPDRIYGMEFARYEIRFKVSDSIVSVVEVVDTLGL